MEACPYCDEALAGSPERCPSCGELLDRPPPEGRPLSGARVALAVLASLFAVVVVLVVLASGFLFYRTAKQGGAPSKCANQLRQISLAALQYSDDKRFLPYTGPIARVGAPKTAGDVTTNHSTRIARGLLWHGYHDNPEGWLCPTRTEDEYLSIGPGVRANMRSWFWGGATTNPGVNPLNAGADPPLDTTYELSYGWTRKPMNRNVRSTAILGADRAVREPGGDQSVPLGGNHEGGWNVSHADATVQWISVDTLVDLSSPAVSAGELLTSTKKGGGYLAIKVQDDPALFSGS